MGYFLPTYSSAVARSAILLRERRDGSFSSRILQDSEGRESETRQRYRRVHPDPNVDPLAAILSEPTPRALAP